MRPPRWDRLPTIKAVMTPFPYSIDVDADLVRAEAMMAEHGIRHLPVIDAGRLIGVISDRDVRNGRAAGAAGSRVRDLYADEPYIVELARPLDGVLLHMSSHHVDCALVVKSGRLAGIFTVTDACRCYGELLRWLYPQDSGDAA